MKGQLDGGAFMEWESPVAEHLEDDWSEEMLRERSKELQLIDAQGKGEEEDTGIRHR